MLIDVVHGIGVQNGYVKDFSCLQEQFFLLDVRLLTPKLWATS